MNRISIIETLLAAGLEGKDAVALSKDHMKDKAQFFAKLHKAQQNLGRIIKDTKDQRGKKYAGVDQFVGKAQRAFNEAGLTMFEHETGVVTRTVNTERHVVNKGGEDALKETTACRSWMIDAIIGDTATGFSMPMHYEVPINPKAWASEPEKAVGAADSYGLKYMTRSVLFAERSEHDPDRRDDPDDKGYDDTPKKPKKPSTPSAAPAKKKTPKKVTVTQRKKAAQARLMATRSKLGNELFNKLCEQNPMNNVDDMEAAVEVFDNRIRLDELTTTATAKFGQPAVDGWLELFRPLTNKTNIDDGITALVTELNSKGKKKK